MQIMNELDLYDTRCDMLGGICAAIIAAMALAFGEGSAVDTDTGLLTRPAT